MDLLQRITDSERIFRGRTKRGQYSMAVIVKQYDHNGKGRLQDDLRRLGHLT